MTERKYNGWTNYETWNVALWMGNEQHSALEWSERAEEAYRWATDRGTGFTKDEQAVLDLAALMKDEYEEAMAALLERSKVSASVWSDLLGAALSEVNWHEIAQHMIDDVDKKLAAAE